MKNNSKDSANLTNTIMNFVFIWWFALQSPDLYDHVRNIFFDIFEIFLNGASIGITHRHGNSWIVILCGIFVSALVVGQNKPSKKTLPHFFTDKEIEKLGSENILEKAKAAFEQAKASLAFRRNLFSFGLIPLREAILEHMLGICIYGTFKASEYSPVTRTVFNYLDIISYKKERKRPDVRYLYSKKFDYVLFSKAKRNEPFGEDVQRFPNWGDIGLLLLASNFFWFWFPIALILWPIHAIKRRRRSK